MAITLSERRMRASEILFDIGAVHCNLEEPFIFTSGWASPVYVNCRKLISSTWRRREVIQYAAEGVERDVGLDGFDIVAGGETAGIPYAAWIADYFHRPMIYVRKRTKEFGLKQRIEGVLEAGQRVLIVEDLMTDGMSKVDFADALKEAGGAVDCAVVMFNYGVYPDTEKNLAGAGLSVHALTDWSTTLDVAESREYFTPEQVKVVRAFLNDPSGWSKAHGGVAG
jgi:orotate phosphoribosyltransferase